MITPSRRGWHEELDGRTFRLSRRRPVRWDVTAGTLLPDLGRHRLAHAVRQDMWRLLRDVRGFQPVVEVSLTDAGCAVRAGGAVPLGGPCLSARVQAMLEDRSHRDAWIRASRHRSVA